MLLSLPIRNILRNKRRSFLTVTAMVFAASLLLLGMGISAGKMHDMLASATEQYHGHLVISKKGYQARRSLFIHFAPSAQISRRILSTPGVTGVSPRLRGFGLLSHEQTALPVEILGIDPEKEANVTTLQRQCIRGTGFDHSRDGVLIGKKLAEKLKAGPGDTLVLVGTGSDGSIANDLLTVKGVFSTENRRNDTALILVPLPWLQGFFVLPGRVHEFAVSMQAPMAAGALAKTLGAGLPGDFEVRDWSRFLPEIRDAIVISHVSNLIILLIFYLAAGLCVFNTVYMSVMDRSREFGVLLALGTRPWQIRRMILAETLVMGGIAVVIGTGLGFAMNFYLQTFGVDLSGHVAPITYGGGTILPVIHAAVQPFPQILAAMVLLLVCLVSGFLPANKAAGLVPIEVIQGRKNA
jgi:ABC-type lipoprotein release transport system permease subunit